MMGSSPSGSSPTRARGGLFQRRLPVSTSGKAAAGGGGGGNGGGSTGVSPSRAQAAVSPGSGNRSPLLAAEGTAESTTTEERPFTSPSLVEAGHSPLPLADLVGPAQPRTRRSWSRWELPEITRVRACVRQLQAAQAQRNAHAQLDGWMDGCRGGLMSSILLVFPFSLSSPTIYRLIPFLLVFPFSFLVVSTIVYRRSSPTPGTGSAASCSASQNFRTAPPLAGSLHRPRPRRRRQRPLGGRRNRGV